MLERALYGIFIKWNPKEDWAQTYKCRFVFMSRQKEKLSLVLVYVDDILLASEDEKWTENIIRKLSNEIPIKNLGKAKNCLGIEITKSR